MKTEYDKDFYINFRKFVVLFMRTFYDIEITGQENIKDNQNYLYVGNHLNILDAWLLMYALDSNLRFMVDEKLYRYKAWEYFFRKLGTFPINQEIKDASPVKKAISLLRNEKENVVIFPEGKTHRITEIVPFKNGMSRLSIMAKSPIMPFGINGNYKPFTKLKLNFGEEIDLQPEIKCKRNWDVLDEELTEKVRKLERR